MRKFYDMHGIQTYSILKDSGLSESIVTMAGQHHNALRKNSNGRYNVAYEIYNKRK